MRDLARKNESKERHTACVVVAVDNTVGGRVDMVDISKDFPSVRAISWLYMVNAHARCKA